VALDVDLYTREDRIARAQSKIESRKSTPLKHSRLTLAANGEDPKKEARDSYLD
jgi:hypothetical protein